MMRQGQTRTRRWAAGAARRPLLALSGAALALALAAAAPAAAQTVPSVPVPGPGTGQFANPAGEADVMMRIDQLESQIRNLTGQIERYDYRIRQLEESLRRFQEDTEFRFQELGAKGKPSGRTTGSASARPQPQSQPQPQPQPQSQPQSQPRSASSPTPQWPTRPQISGQPETYGGIKPLAPPGTVPQGRAPRGGAPLDISPPSLSGSRGAPQEFGSGGLRPFDSGSSGDVALAVPNDPETGYEVAYAFILQRDYEAAQSAFADFLVRYPQHKLAANAQYWLGEALYAQGEYREAADSFLTVYRKHKSSDKAPDSLLKLAMSLKALGEKEAACASLAEFGRTFPKASSSLKEKVRAERKGAGC